MTNKDAIKYLIAPVATSTEPSAEYLKQKEAYDLAIQALETGEIYITGEDYDFFIRGYKEGRKDFERHQPEWVTDELCRLRSCLRSGTHVGSYLQTPAQMDRFIKALDEVIKHD